MTSSAPLTLGCNPCLIALLVIGSILLFGSGCPIPKSVEVKATGLDP